MTADSDIAIVGIGLRVPGANNATEYWHNLQAGVESVQRYTDEQLLAAGERPDRLQHPRYVRAGAPLGDMPMFDGEFFGFSPKESAILDPQHRHFMEVAWEALEDAGHPPERFSGPVGVFAGCGMGSYFYFNLCSRPDLVESVGMFLLRHTGNDKDFLTTRVSYLLDLKGPSVAVQTACSTSLVALHQAVQSLLSGECDMALAGGATIELPHRRGYIYQEREILSPDGKCHAFDHRAQGTVFGSGAGVVVLRRLADALDDGDHIYAVVKGSAINNDGSSKSGYLAPSVDGQAAAVAEALAVADISAECIEYVECHGTGTYLGDPLEVAALTQAFRESTQNKGFCRIGSVKTNIGHLDTAAGVAGLAKVCLALKHKQIPPSLNFDKANPAIDFDNSPFSVASERLDWAKPANHPRRASVNSLGVGGTNAHVVLEEAPARTTSPSKRKWQPIVLSARNNRSLDAQCERLAAHVEEQPDLSLADIAYTLLECRRPFARRRVLACQSTAELVQLLRQRPTSRVFTHAPVGEAPRVVFLLPGGGTQYVHMAKDLYDDDAHFRTWMDRGLSHLQRLAGADLKELLFPAPSQAEQAAIDLLRPSRQLPLLFIVEFSLAKLWIEEGVEPAALIGHSLGENTAAALAEVMTFEEGIGLTLKRGQLFETVPEGGMLSVPLSEAALRAQLPPELDLACINGPELCVASGPKQPLLDFAAALQQQEIEAKPISIHIAAHSRMLESILEDFRAHLKTIRLQAPKLPVISNQSGQPLTVAEATSPDYWVEHLRHTVHFARGIETLAQDSNTVFLEVGPGRGLGSLAKQCTRVNPQSVLPTLRHVDEKVNDSAFFTAARARLWALGTPLNASHLWPQEARLRLPLPTYAFDHQHYWIDPGQARASDEGNELLIKEPDLKRWFYQTRFVKQDALGSETQAQSFLLFLDSAGIGEALAKRLEADHHRVVRVVEGDVFHKQTENLYTLSYEQGLSGYEALVRELLASGKLPEQIVHMGLLNEAETFRPGSSLFHTHLERGFFSLLLLGQALGGQDYPGQLQLTVVTNGMERVADEPLPHPEKATVLGPALVLTREFAHIHCRVVDVQLEDRSPSDSLVRLLAGPAIEKLRKLSDKPRTGLLHSEAVDALKNELQVPPAHQRIALRTTGRWVAQLQRTSLTEQWPSFKQGGAYLITGGLSGIGLELGKYLAKKYQARLVLVGRTKLPEPGTYQAEIDKSPNSALSERLRALLELQQSGAQVLAMSADVTHLERMQEVVASATRHFGPLHGVVHAAGALRDHPILGKRQEDIDAVLAPKVYGTLVLQQVLAAQPVDFLVLFSSTSAVTAAAGQVDYVAANAYLNAVAAQSRGQSTRTIALGWGVWRDIGMGVQALQQAAQGSAAAHEAATESVTHPLFDTLSTSQDGERTVQGRWSPATHWILNEHRTANGAAILPGTGYLEVFRGAIAAVEAGRPVELSDVYFLKPLYVADDDTQAVRVTLKADERGYEVALVSEPKGANPAAQWTAHATGKVSLLPLPEAERLDVAAIEARCPEHRHAQQSGSIATGQEDHLLFGPRWRVLRQLMLGKGEALARLQLPDPFVHDLESYALHPALLDLATGYAMELIEGYDRANLWVPVSYQNIKVYGPLPAKIWSWVRVANGSTDQSGFVHFDVTIAAEDGSPCVVVEGFTIKKLADAQFITPQSNAERGPSLETVRQNSEVELSPQQVAFQHQLSQGIGTEEGLQQLEAVVAGRRDGEVLVSSMDLFALEKRARESAARAMPSESKFSRPQLDSEYEAPSNDIERTLVEFWEELLGVDQVGVNDSFFDLGGHSLIALRLFAKIKKTYRVDYPMSVLFDASTVRACAQLLQESLGEDDTPKSKPTGPRYQHLVKMHQGDPARDARPFFLVAGMFGNVLNLRHLAGLVGSDRPCYGLQARGLYGDTPPHETFEEMAEDYLKEIRTVQPEGPYVLGGFSGGGIAAFEMARQLLESGQQVSHLVMLDTPLPGETPLTKADKLTIRLQDLKRQKAALAVNWVREKLEYRERMRLQQEQLESQASGQSHDFHSQMIEAAFYRALSRYQLKKLPVNITLFRPVLQPQYILRDGRRLNFERSILLEDNGWTQWVDDVDVHEVPGSHDSMVLEPNVRVLATALGKTLNR